MNGSTDCCLPTSRISWKRRHPKLGMQIEGDVTESARFAPSGEEGAWLRNLRPRYPNGMPEFLTVRRDAVIPGIESSRICFLRPGDIIFDALCDKPFQSSGVMFSAA